MGLDSQRDELRGACSPDAFQRRSRQPRESSLPRLVNKLCRLFSNSSSQPARHGKASRKRPSASRSLSASASPKKMPCPHQRLRKSCSADCSDASRVSRKSAQHISPLQQGISSSCRASPAISEHSRLSATSSSTSSSCGSSGGASERHIRFSDEALVRDACSRGDLTSLTSLLDDLAVRKSVDMRAMRHNAYGRTLLHEVAHRGSKRMIEVLLRYGSDPNAPDNNGDRPLHAAALRGSYEISELLLQYGAKVHLFNAELRLPIDIARARQDYDVVRLLSDAAHAQAAFECHQARRDAGMLGPSIAESSSSQSSAATRQRLRRPSVDGAMQTLTKAHGEGDKDRIFLRRLASDEPPRHSRTALSERRLPGRGQSHQRHLMPTRASGMAKGRDEMYQPSSDTGCGRPLRLEDDFGFPLPRNRVGAEKQHLAHPGLGRHAPLSRYPMPNPLITDLFKGELGNGESKRSAVPSGKGEVSKYPCEMTSVEL
eukprot:scpid30259/ scgid28222/ Ankyrin repeat domain-containing protein 2